MNWLEKFTDLFKTELPEDELEFESIFQRLDVDAFFGMLNNYWKPSELINKIGGYENLDLLYKDSEIYAAVDKRLAALLDTRLVLKGPSETTNKFFMDQIGPFEQQLKQDLWWTVAHGFGVEQIIYDPDRSCKVIGFQKEEFWRFEPQKDLIHVKLVNTNVQGMMNKILPYGKWVLTTNNGTFSNPFGESMFERLIQPWIFRCNGWDLWMDFAKRFANGFLHARIDSTDEVTAKAVRVALEKSGKSSVLVTDKGSELNLIQPSRDSSLYTTIDDKTIASIQKVILGETQTSEMQARGSSASAAVHNEVRLEKTRADIRLVEDGINQIIKQIALVCEMNEELPKASLIYDPGLSSELAARDAVLSGVGVKFEKKYFVNNYGLKEDEFRVEDPQPQSFFNQKKKSLYLKPEDVKEYLSIDDTCIKCAPEGKRTETFAPNVRRKDSRQLNEREEAVQFLNRNGRQPIDINDLTTAILSSKDEKELDDKLLALFSYDSPDFIDDLTDTLYYTATKGALIGNPEKLDPKDLDEKK